MLPTASKWTDHLVKLKNKLGKIENKDHIPSLLKEPEGERVQLQVESFFFILSFSRERTRKLARVATLTRKGFKITCTSLVLSS